jgi:hypothetical protein
VERIKMTRVVAQNSPVEAPRFVQFPISVVRNSVVQRLDGIGGRWHRSYSRILRVTAGCARFSCRAAARRLQRSAMVTMCRSRASFMERYRFVDGMRILIHFRRQPQVTQKQWVTASKAGKIHDV